MGTRTLGDALGTGFDAVLRGLVSVMDLVSLRDLRFGLDDMPDLTWAEAPALPAPSRGQLRRLRDRLLHLDSVTRFPQPLIQEIGELLQNVPGLRAQWLEIANDLWGWDGSGRKTPELVAWRHHITPHRAREIDQILKNRLAQIGRPVYLPTARAIADIINELGESATRFHVARLAEGRDLITRHSELDALEALEAVGLVPAGTWRWGAPAASSPSPARRRRRPRRQPPEVEAQMTAFRQLVDGLTSANVVYLVELEPTDNRATIRRRLLQAASGAGVEIVVRKHADGWLVGLMTPDRRRGGKA